ncbi:hypothetical protein NQ317_009707 [Molorchus minor]|uniref:Uncharacterized protein n=1 Tax=Molorchus minor TaxID=1323400 RepID=A0ABQ9JKI5_9CUCU|nr:hypothetical protein NQ317_009707 [Molorchus minor]
MYFSNWVLERHRTNANFFGAVLFTDEAGFSKNGIIISHNLHLWADENPHASIVTHHQHQFDPINVWAGIIWRHLFGPFVLPRRLTGKLYLEFLQNNFPELLEDLTLVVRRVVMHEEVQCFGLLDHQISTL